MAKTSKTMFTVSEAAEKYGVTRQRMHQLIDTYSLKAEFIGPIRQISLQELRKIPKNRPTGKTLSK